MYLSIYLSMQNFDGEPQGPQGCDSGVPALPYPLQEHPGQSALQPPQRESPAS
jgi:hypothetical protein